MTTNWQPIDSHPEYFVSDDGRVRRTDVLAPDTIKGGYQRVQLWTNGVRTRRLVHLLVLETFVGPCPPGLEARHRNGVSFDNRLSNLTWGTHSENQLDKVAHGTHHHARKTHCVHGHEFTEANTYRRGRHRHCRTCRRNAMRKVRA